MRNLSFSCLLFAASVTAAPFVMAEKSDTTMSNFSYNYTEVRIGVSPVSYGVGFVKSIHPNAHIRADIDSKFESDFDSTLAVGFHAPINDWADLYGEIGLRSVEQPGLFNNDTKFGVEINLGVRQWIAPQIEISAEVGHLSISNKEDLFGSISGRFHATELFSIGLQGRFNEIYGDQLIFNTRFVF